MEASGEYISKPILEKVPDGRFSFHVKRETGPYLTYPLHYHPEYELTMILEGEGTRFAGNSIELFGPDDFVLMGKSLPHVWKNNREHYENKGLVSDCIVIQFQPNCFGSDFFSLPEVAEIAQLLEESKFGIRFSESACSLAKPRLHELCQAHFARKIVLFLEIMDICAHDENRYALTTLPLSVVQHDADLQRMAKVYEFVVNRLNEEIRPEDIAGLLGLTVPSFCRFFRRCSGNTFTDFVNRLRIEYAAKLLLSGKHSFTSVCYEAGYNSVSYFNRMFKRIKDMTPSEFIQAYQRIVL